MSPSPPAAAGRWPLVGAVLAVAGYAVLSHVLMVRFPPQAWTVALLFGPLLLAVGGMAWKQRHLPGLAAVAAGVAGVAWVVAQGGVDDVNKLYVLQHAGIHAALALGFATTLSAGAVPMITGLAARLHAMTPGVRDYTRGLTQLWVAYFAFMTTASVLLYAFAPWPLWSFFANLITPVSAALFFVGEHLVRYRLHPEFERISLGDAVRAYRNRVPTAGP